METALKRILTQAGSREEFKTVLEDCVRRGKSEKPFVVEKVFGKKQLKYQKLLVDTLTQWQHEKKFWPEIEISFNSDASKFRFLRCLSEKKSKSLTTEGAS